MKDIKGLQVAFSALIFHIKLFKSLVLLVFLASLLYHCKDIKAIVPKIASIVITTISSTKVNAFLVFFIKKEKIRK
jgi:hypothetical protein